MKEDTRNYDNFVKETYEKINRLDTRFNFGIEVHKIKNDIFKNDQENHPKFLPKLKLNNLNSERSQNIIALSQREKNNEKLPQIRKGIFFYVN